MSGLKCERVPCGGDVGVTLRRTGEGPESRRRGARGCGGVSAGRNRGCVPVRRPVNMAVDMVSGDGGGRLTDVEQAVERLAANPPPTSELHPCGDWPTALAELRLPVRPGVISTVAPRLI